jgi:hypothetical protein
MHSHSELCVALVISSLFPCGTSIGVLTVGDRGGTLLPGGPPQPAVAGEYLRAVLSSHVCIEPHGTHASSQASIVRVVRRVGRQPSQAFVIANKRSQMPLREAAAVWTSASGNATSRADVAERLQWHVDVAVPLSCTVRPMARGSWVELEEAAGRLAAFVERTRLGGRARFTELVADFLKGRDGRWYFLQVCATLAFVDSPHALLSPNAGTSVALDIRTSSFIANWLLRLAMNPPVGDALPTADSHEAAACLR